MFVAEFSAGSSVQPDRKEGNVVYCPETKAKLFSINIISPNLNHVIVVKNMAIQGWSEILTFLFNALVLSGVGTVHHQWKTLIHNIKKTNVSTGLSPHHIVCSHYDRSECAICSVQQLYENSMLLNHRVLTTQNSLSTHLTCELHKHSEGIAHRGTQTHTRTHAPPTGAPQGP